jgi:hypothetical protein
MTDLLGRIDRWAVDLGIETEHLNDHCIVVTLPGSKRLQVPVALTVTPQALLIETFVARGTDQDPRPLYEFLLRRNSKAFGVAYCTDKFGDVYLVGRLPISGVNEEALDLVLASVMGMADGDFNTILELGFSESIEREWKWRLARGESTANLEAFTHLRPSES